MASQKQNWSLWNHALSLSVGPRVATEIPRLASSIRQNLLTSWGHFARLRGLDQDQLFWAWRKHGMHSLRKLDSLHAVRFTFSEAAQSLHKGLSCECNPLHHKNSAWTASHVQGKRFWATAVIHICSWWTGVNRHPLGDRHQTQG